MTKTEPSQTGIMFKQRREMESTTTERKEAEKQRRAEQLFHETLETLCCNTPNLLNFNTFIRMNAKELILINMLYTVTCY